LRNLGSVDRAAKAIPLVNSNPLLAVISVWNLKGTGSIPAELPATLGIVRVDRKLQTKKNQGVARNSGDCCGQQRQATCGDLGSGTKPGNFSNTVILI